VVEGSLVDGLWLRVGWSVWVLGASDPGVAASRLADGSCAAG
jgi:hypothetical protein